MNLNIYGQTSSSINDLEANLRAQLDKLNQLKLLSNPQANTQQLPQVSNADYASTNVQNNTVQVQPQRYYLDCGIKEDWDDFLRLNYGITEKDIFDDYKLFLQAKQEIISEQGKSKLETMKERIKNSRSVIVEKPNVQPMEQPTSVQQPVQQPMQQPVGDVGIDINTTNRDIVKPIDGLLPTVQKVGDRQGKTKKQ